MFARFILPSFDSELTINKIFKTFKATIFVPLFEAGFVQRVIPTSNKPECDFSKAIICRSDECDSSGAWCKSNIFYD